MIHINDSRLQKTQELIALDSHKWSTKIEYEALALILYCCGTRFGKLYHADAPDLQDQFCEWGVEVVRAADQFVCETGSEIIRLISAKRRGAESAANKYCGNFESVGGKVLYDAKGILRGFAMPTFDEKGDPMFSEEKELSGLKTIVKRKLEKLPTYAKRGFRHMGLFVHIDTEIAFCNSQERMRCLIDVQKTFKDPYEVIFLFSRGSGNDWLLAECDMKRETCCEYEIKEEIANRLGRLAYLTAMGAIKDDDVIWGR